MRRLLLTFLFAGLTLAGFPQDEKFSVSTQIFLNQQSGKFSSDVEIKTKENQSVSGVQLRHRRGSDKGRFVASPDTIDGKAYISAFLRLKDNNDLEAIKALGVEVQCKFDKGLVTVNIPVDKIRDVIRHAKDTSMYMAIKDVRDGNSAAVVSAGNTGVLMALSKLALKTVDGIYKSRTGA